MGTSTIVIFGAGGFGREALDVIDAENAVGTPAQRRDFLGFIDPNPDRAKLEQRGAVWIGDDRVANDLRGSEFVVAVGNSSLRKRIVDRAVAAGLRPSRLIHPSATFGSVADIGVGSVICAHVSVSTNVRIGRYVHLNPASTVGHDAVIGDFVSINPGATVSGGVVLEDEVLMGANSVVIEGLRIGRGSVVGAGAAVVRSLPPGIVAMGVPARVSRALDADQ